MQRCSTETLVYKLEKFFSVIFLEKFAQMFRNLMICKHCNELTWMVKRLKEISKFPSRKRKKKLFRFTKSISVWKSRKKSFDLVFFSSGYATNCAEMTSQ